MGDKKEVVKKEEVITAVYRLHLHCPECSRQVERQFTKISGVQKVDVDYATGKVSLKGVFDVKKIHEHIERKTRKKVELISPKPEVKILEQKKEVYKKGEIRTMTLKAYMHCPKCEEHLKFKMLEHKGIHKFETNRAAQTCTVVGTIEEKELLEYLFKRTRKHGTILPPKVEKINVEEKTKTIKVAVKDGEVEITKKKEEVKVTDQTIDHHLPPYYPYHFVNYYPPPYGPAAASYHCYSFSDEDPNACSVM